MEYEFYSLLEIWVYTEVCALCKSSILYLFALLDSLLRRFDFSVFGLILSLRNLE
uniref:Uncharacterized protein n=1 Tax=Manihot esculenta TaxID=3983 RepID=A0A2C9W0T4_MANES